MTTGSGTVTILFTDVERSTELLSALGDERMRALLRAHEQLLRAAISTHGGREIKRTFEGDAVMAAFPTAAGALNAAIEMQRGIEAPFGEDEHRLRIRIGVNAGEPIAEDGDLHGTAVTRAARIRDQGDGGEIVVSDVVRGLVAGRGFSFQRLGRRRLRGFDEETGLFLLEWQAGGDAESGERGPLWRWAWPAGALAFTGVVLAGLWLSTGSGEPSQPSPSPSATAVTSTPATQTPVPTTGPDATVSPVSISPGPQFPFEFTPRTGGGRIAFISNRDDQDGFNVELYVMDADGTSQERLPSFQTELRNPSWSPDGKRIALDGGLPMSIFVVNDDGSGLVRLGNAESRDSEATPVWAPDGSGVAFFRLQFAGGMQQRELWWSSVDDDNRRRLVSLSQLASPPSWSPDGTRIVVSLADLRGRDVHILDSKPS